MFQNKVSVLEAYMLERLVSQMRGLQNPDYQLVNADHMFIAENLTLRPCMEDLFVTKDYAKKLDFKKDVNFATDYINQWVSNNTRGQINQLIGPGRLSPDSKLVLVSST